MLERLQGVFVSRDEVEVVAELAAAHGLVAHVGRGGDEQIVGHLATVEADQFVVFLVHFFGDEVGDELDAFVS
jgi:hypothetical protein